MIALDCPSLFILDRPWSSKPCPSIFYFFFLDPLRFFLLRPASSNVRPCLFFRLLLLVFSSKSVCRLSSVLDRPAVRPASSSVRPASIVLVCLFVFSSSICRHYILFLFNIKLPAIENAMKTWPHFVEWFKLWIYLHLKTVSNLEISWKLMNACMYKTSLPNWLFLYEYRYHI